MLTIVVSGPNELYDEDTHKFLEDESESVILNLEHSLISLAKWEAIHKKAFLTNEDKTPDEIVSYIKCMTITRNISDEVYKRLSDENIQVIKEYMEDSMTATWFSDRQTKSREIITAEIIYYWMIVVGVWLECEKWHLNRLLTLIRVCDIKASKPKTMSRREAVAMQRELNDQRRKELGTKG